MTTVKIEFTLKVSDINDPQMQMLINKIKDGSFEQELRPIDAITELKAIVRLDDEQTEV